MRLSLKQRRDSRGPLTCPLARIPAAQEPLREVFRWLERPAHGTGARPHRVQQAWEALRRRLDGPRALGLAYAGFEPSGSDDRLAPLEPPCRLRATLAGMVRAALRAQDKGHLREWRTWLKEAYTPD